MLTPVDIYFIIIVTIIALFSSLVNRMCASTKRIKKKNRLSVIERGSIMEWDELYRECETCTRCGLYSGRKNLVFGTGNRDADLMFVGEAPGATEDELGIPFVGAAGKLFDKYLVAVGIRREDVYIANILKCHPPMNRDPSPEESEACIAHLREQVKLVRPKMIVCLGRIAASRLIKPDFRITKEHGIIEKKGSFLITSVYHPSALLRDPSKKEDMLTDMKKIAALVGDNQTYN